MGISILKHPLVIIVAVLLAALVFYNIASPYKNCVRNNVERYSYTTKATGNPNYQECMKECLDGSNNRQYCDLLLKSNKHIGIGYCKESVKVKRPAGEAEKRAASYCSKKDHSW